MKKLLQSIAALLAVAVAMPAMGQGITIYKKDGSKIDFPSSEIDSIVTYDKTFENCTYTVNGVEFTMVAVKGGTFMMGATEEQGTDAQDNEQPAHQVTLSDYYIGETEVTQELWQAVMGENPSHDTTSNQNPVERVTLMDCLQFAAKLSNLTGEDFTLPSEAQWEYAARGGQLSQGYKYSGSNNVDEVAWHDGNSNFVSHPVKGKKANELGIYDMSGNVYEWVGDWYALYSGAPQVDPEGPETGDEVVFRGGSALIGSDRSRVSFRYPLDPGLRNWFIGMRLVKRVK